MFRNKKKSRRLDLLEMPNSERMRLTREVREKLRRKVIEVRLWQSLLEVENLTVNGNVVYKENQQLSGFYLRNRI